ncbi:hypothetical protein [Ligilactobacillus equi]|uniref:ATPase n=2 Tax=Ligilactobacillus equi TaxID=137357 RepID=V7HZP5_9LACO|nr:hypothetical protein [Ligilactobacillus equi]ETA74491.1 ATPase [Ligilactobacillus equi DPC 6820]KRL78114.1 hypothetical protein FC36_GL001164 [Ligilactobacillus equi DSM 15833 = JCM 10991]
MEKEIYNLTGEIIVITDKEDKLITQYEPDGPIISFNYSKNIIGSISNGSVPVAILQPQLDKRCKYILDLPKSAYVIVPEACVNDLYRIRPDLNIFTPGITKVGPFNEEFAISYEEFVKRY